MQQIVRAVPLLALIGLAACSSTGTMRDLGPTLPQPGQTPTLQTSALPAPSQQIATAQSLTDVTAFIDPTALRR